MRNIKPGSLFGYVQCDIEISENFREVFANFPPNQKNINVVRDDIVPLMKEYAEKEGLLNQPRRMLISSYLLENEAIITPLLLVFVDLRLVSKNNYCFLQCTPMKCFNKFVPSAVNDRKEGGENPISSVVAETMKIPSNSFYGFQIMDRS